MRGTIRITKEFHFEMAHALWKYEGACKHIHGHSYRLLVTLIGEPVAEPGRSDFGMVTDFKEVKTLLKGPIVDNLDHSLLLYKEADPEQIRALGTMSEKLHVMSFQPTCENLVLYLSGKIRDLLPGRIRLHSLRLYETATSYAEWFASDNEEPST
ncbi:MAG: 6-carboxytetrahydropterin synthase [Bacteroidales bacterium]